MFFVSALLVMWLLRVTQPLILSFTSSNRCWPFSMQSSTVWIFWMWLIRNTFSAPWYCHVRRLFCTVLVDSGWFNAISRSVVFDRKRFFLSFFEAQDIHKICKIRLQPGDGVRSLRATVIMNKVGQVFLLLMVIVVSIAYSKCKRSIIFADKWNGRNNLSHWI